VSKVLWRLIPFMIVLYVMNYLDRVNVSFAKLQMNVDLAFSEKVYGLGASIFFIGYFVFEVPSNLIMERVGARIWMARIMVSWGLISAAMMFVRGETSFYVLRFLLGVAEAGFFPGMILYMTYWIPARQRAQAAAWFLTSTALSGVIGGPLAGLLLQMDGVPLFGTPLKGWQWLFLVEGVPTVLLGFVILFYLDDKPRDARWLTAAEKDWLEGTLARERARIPHGSHRLRDAFAERRVWVLSALYGTMMFGFYGINYWTPSIVKGVTGSDSSVVIGFLSAIPFLAAAVGMVLIGRYADATGRRRATLAACAAVGAAGMALAAVNRTPVLALASLSVAAVGIWGTLGPFWSLPSQFLRGTAAAAGIGLINSIGNLFGGFVGPNVMADLKDRTGSYGVGLWVNAGVLMLTFALGFILARQGEHRHADEHPGEPVMDRTREAELAGQGDRA
jgi:MFS transporter, ACS family, tartrate transporter